MCTVEYIIQLTSCDDVGVGSAEVEVARPRISHTHKQTYRQAQAGRGREATDLAHKTVQTYLVQP